MATADVDATDESKSGDDIHGHSDALTEYFCTPCRFDDETIEAEHYCADCDKYFCVTCLKYHKKLGNCPGLNVLGKSEIQRWGQTKQEKNKAKHMCGKHPEKELEMYCGEHDIVCCHVCVSLEHRSCKDIAYIPHVANDLKTNGEKEKLKKNTVKISADANALKSVKEQDRVTLDQSKDDYNKTIVNFREKYFNVLNNLADKTTEEMDEFYDKHELALEADIKDLDEIQNNMAQIENYLADTMDECDAFIYIKESKKKVDEANKAIAAKSRQRNVKYKFTIDDNIDMFLSAVSSLDPNLDKHLEGSKNLGQSVPEPLIDSNVTNTNSKITFKEKAVSVQKYNDYHSNPLCSIRGSCSHVGKANILVTQTDEMSMQCAECFHKPELQITLVGDNSDCSKKIDVGCITELQVSVDEGDTPTLRQQRIKRENNHVAVPIGVCYITDNDIATTLSNRTIVIFPLSHNISLNKFLEKTMSFEHDCFGIAYHDGILYVSSQEGSMYMYNLGQRLIKKIQDDSEGNSYFYKAQHMTISPDKRKLYVTDWFKGLVTLDMAGHVLSSFSHPDLAGACDVTTDADGHVFVCGHHSKNVLQIASSGDQIVQIVISGLSFAPTTISFISTLSYLMVGGGSTMKAYEVEKEKANALESGQEEGSKNYIDIDCEPYWDEIIIEEGPMYECYSTDEPDHTPQDEFYSNMVNLPPQEERTRFRKGQKWPKLGINSKLVYK